MGDGAVDQQDFIKFGRAEGELCLGTYKDN